MKNLSLTALMAVLFLITNTFSQFTFVRTDPQIVYGNKDSAEIASFATVTNTTNSSITISIDLIILSMPNGWDTTVAFCTWQNCYPPLFFHKDEVCTPGAHTFDVYLNPNHIQNLGSVRVTMTYQTTTISQDFGFSTFPVGIKQITSNVEEFKLNQNYPNPFNPSTKIGFSIPKNEFTDLRVYDILGREVSVLVSGYINAGVYEVEWEAKNLSSGIYYYRLKTQDNVSVKKMTLVK